MSSSRALPALPIRPGAATRALPARSFPNDQVKLHSPGWLYAFIAAEIALQLLIVTPWGEKAHILVRSGASIASFSLLFVLHSSRVAHPAWKVALAAMAVVTLSIFHPDTNGTWAGCATAFQNLAVVAPIFWLPRIRTDLNAVRRVFFLLWTFHTASAVLGALQIYFPQLQPALASTLTDDYLQALTYELANGERIVRPMGLSNSPGGAAISAMYCLVLGVPLLLDRPRAWVRVAIVIAMGTALFTLFLSQVRGLVVMTGISLLATSLPLARQRRFGSLGALAMLMSILVLGGLFVATSIGGEAVTTRLSSLIQEDPLTVYDANRGHFLRHTFMNLLPEYPMGAGLGRYGMLVQYFGDHSSPSLWAEIQWTGWLYDGGVLLVALYGVAFVIAFRVAFRIATSKANAVALDLQKWATTVFGYSVGIFSLTFSSVPFLSNMGIDFWVLNTIVFAASHQAQQSTSSR